jgi:PPM family protein phosphatase
MTELRWGSATDVGRVRQENEDAFFTSDELFVVADGMGGHRGGEVASGLATQALEEGFGPTIDPRSTDELVRAVQRANEVVVGKASDDPDLTGMGTTLCAMALVRVDGDERLAIVNVGDSRAYLLKSGTLEQITDDHSLVATLERQGRLTRDEAAVHPQRNILTRALGIDARVMVDSWEVRPVVGDRYVLCSDGLFNEVDESRMAATLRKLADPTDAARELVRLANESGGRDNITLVIVDVVDHGSAPESAADVDASDRVIAAVSGEARATGDAAGGDAPPPPSARERRAQERAGRRAVARANRPRHFTWRVLLFIVVIIAIVGAAFGAITYYARDTYFVGFDHDAVVIYRGRPGGVLWIKPELVEKSGLTRQTIPKSSVPEIEAGKVEPTRDDAHRYLTNLADQATEQGTGSTTSTTAPGH